MWAEPDDVTAVFDAMEDTSRRNVPPMSTGDQRVLNVRRSVSRHRRL